MSSSFLWDHWNFISKKYIEFYDIFLFFVGFYNCHFHSRIVQFFYLSYYIAGFRYDFFRFDFFFFYSRDYLPRTFEVSALKVVKYVHKMNFMLNFLLFSFLYNSRWKSSRWSWILVETNMTATRENDFDSRLYGPSRTEVILLLLWLASNLVFFENIKFIKFVKNNF